MLAFILRRLVISILVLWFISFLIFTLIYLQPCDPTQIYLGHRPPDPAVVRHVQAEYHLNDPFLTQYFEWLKNALHGEFGRSIVTGQTVTSTIASRAPVSIVLGLYAFFGMMFFGVLLGMWSALKSRSIVGRTIDATVYVGMCTPSFVLAVFLLYVFAVQLGWFPAFGAGSGLLDRLYHLTLPALAIMIGGIAQISLFTRTSMVTSLDKDYVAFARARGLSRRRVMFGHALRTALIPVVTIGGGTLAYLLIGTVIVESTFALPGLGNLLLTSLHNKDIPVIQTLAVMIAATVVLMNLLTDMAYMVVDPRIRFDPSQL